MDQIVQINKDVNIVAYYFRSNARRLRCFPKRMEYNGKRIEFTETGRQRSAGKEQGNIQIFDMTDGSADYRLEFDPLALSWKLVYVTDTHYAPVFSQFATI